MAAPENRPSDDPESELSNLEFLDSDDSENAGTTSDSDNAATEIEQVFQDAIQVAHLEDQTQLPTHLRPPGPGLLESICWMFGVFGAHFAGIMLFIVGAFIYLMMTTNLGQDAVTIQKNLTQFFESHPIEMAGVEQGIFVLIAMAAIGLRLRKGILAKVNLQPFAISTGLLLFISVIPLSMLSGEFYRIAFEAWSTFSEQLPFLKRFNELQTMEMVKQMAENSPLWALVLVIAVFPAIGEEIVFRGVIGRGLLARWGLIPGIVITSIMFGIVHVHPAHVFAVIPLGMFMHFVYYVTRSFWAPVLVHFLNNAFAVSMAKMISELPENAAKLGDETQAVHPLITLTAALFIAVVCVYLWKTRARYVTPTGSEWTPGYISNERPPSGTSVTLERKPAALAFYPGLALLYLLFLATMGMFGLQ
ncbi:CAAX amino terminal protease self- immunity [Gimesia alba]|uniref:CAAX amino terminal protease self-immunity n=1 Tax=Gimesia alba TaxID=2527973 RepID=A0A517RG96_9PLAN|nr:CPBP family intramembrane glutamic endopeptidase [Gimesia alba]QDT42899.1 CAAX amino terminal protease self- immunity [Gimesia alba]